MRHYRKNNTLRLLRILANLANATGARLKTLAGHGALPALEYAIMNADIRWKQRSQSSTACEPDGSSK